RSHPAGLPGAGAVWQGQPRKAGPCAGARGGRGAGKPQAAQNAAGLPASARQRTAVAAGAAAPAHLLHLLRGAAGAGAQRPDGEGAGDVFAGRDRRTSTATAAAGAAAKGAGLPAEKNKPVATEKLLMDLGIAQNAPAFQELIRQGLVVLSED